MKPFFYLSAFITILCSCSKKTDTPPTPPPVNTKETYIILTQVNSKLYIAEKGYVTINGLISGEEDNYNTMEVFVIDQHSDTLARTYVDGQHFSLKLDSTLTAGEYNVKVKASDPEDATKTISSEEIKVIACVPPPLRIYEAKHENNQIIVNWEKSGIYNFKAYELYSYKWGESSDSTLVATFTDVNTTVFHDTSIYFYNKYSYRIKLITLNDCASEGTGGGYVDPARYLILRTDADIANSVYHAATGSFYFTQPASNTATSLIAVQTDSIEHWSGIKQFNYGSYITGFNETGKLQVMEKDNFLNLRMSWIDVLTGSYDEQSSLLTLPTFEDRIKIVWGNLALFTGRTNQNKGYVGMYDHNTQNVSVIWQGEYLNVIPVKNKERFVITSAMDSFFVYGMVNGIAELQKKGLIPGLSQMHKKNVFSCDDFFTVGGNKYDYNYNLLHSLNPGESFIGLSGNGSYAVSSVNEIYETATMNMVHKYGDGLKGIVYFSKDNNTIVHLAEYIPYYERPLMYQYRWR
jgi:hypothetical protein